MNDYGLLPPINQIKKDPMLFVSELTSKPSVTLEELLNARKSVQNCADETNTQLKKNVYKNYQLFIDTSKEISYLKSEMSQLSRYLNDENKLLESLLSISIGGSKTGLSLSEKKEALEKVKEERERKMLQMSQANMNGPLPTKEFRTIIENIEGGAGMLDNRQNCLVYCDGEVIELDENYLELQSLYLILLNDALIITTLMNDRKIPQNKNFVNQLPIRKYKFQSIIDLESIAVVNVKDRRYKKFEMAFKILMATSDKVFLTNSPVKKKAWIDAFEAAKKYLRTNRLQRRDSLYLTPSSISNSSRSDSNTNSNFELMNSSKIVSNSKTALQYTSTSINPFEETKLEENNQTDPELPCWLVDLPDDLDICIAQRNFEEAVKLVTRAHEHFYLYPKWCDNQMQVDLKLKIDNKISELVDALTSELNIAPDRSLQTGPRASRRAVGLLVRLGKSSLAIRLFLEQRRRLLKYYFKQQKVTAGATISFMKRMTNLFFSHFVETSKEFLRAFEICQSESITYQDEIHISSEPNVSLGWLENNNNDIENEETSNSKSNANTNLYSHTALACLNAWIYEEFNRYLDLFPRHVFINQVNTLAAVECISLAIGHCLKLRQTIGLDLLFVLSKRLKTNIQSLIMEINGKFMEAIKLRANDDHMKPTVFDTKNKLNKFITEMNEYGLDVKEFIEDYNSEDDNGSNKIYTVLLSQNTATFVKSYLNTLKDLLKLANNSHSIKMINKILVQTFQWQMNHLKNSMNSLSTKNNEFVRKNIIFMLDKFVPVVIQKYCDILNVRSFNHLQTASLQYTALKDNTNSSASMPNPDYSPIVSPVPTPRARKSPRTSSNNSNESSIDSSLPVSPVNNQTTATYL